MLRPTDTDSRGKADGSDEKDAVGCGASDPLQVVAEEQALQLELCNLLEALADSLPYDLDRNLVEVAVSTLGTCWPKHVSIGEECLFPMLRARAKVGSRVKETLLQLEQEHIEDEDRAAEIISALQAFLKDDRVANPESLGYMLRGFFDAQRRHIGWEKDVVLPTARDVLNKSDLDQMQAWMISSDHPRCSKQLIVEIRDAQRRGQIRGERGAKNS